MNGTKFIVGPRETGLVETLYTGLLEFEDMAFFLHYIDEDDLFIEVGSNVGTYTLLCCGVKGARGYAFEPVPRTYGRFWENVRLNHLEARVKGLNLCVGEKPGSLFFTTGENVTNHVQTKGEAGKSIKVKVATLDSILRKENPTALKIDVEGFEIPVLRGAKLTLRKPGLSVVLVETNGSGDRYGFGDAAIVSKMGENGFLPYSYDPLRRELKLLGGANPRHENTLFIRDLKHVQKKVKNAEKFQVLSHWI
jgi:FkbM family methyltransferase